MKCAVYSAKPYDREYLGRANAGRHELIWVEEGLSATSAALSVGAPAVCAFVRDQLDSTCLTALAAEAPGAAA